jgi:hypothetical protein
MDSVRSDLTMTRKVLMKSFAVGGGLEKRQFHSDLQWMKTRKLSTTKATLWVKQIYNE